MAAFSRGTGDQGGHSSSGLLSRQAMTNLGAQGGALAAVSLASLMVARTGGPKVIGYYTLIRVLPWLFGVILSSGLPTASAFFLAGEHGRDRRVRPTLALMAAAGSGLAALTWLACAIPLHALFFRQLPIRLVAVIAALVITQLWTVTAKGCCQGSRDIAGANLIIVAEELWFVPVYPAVLLLYGYRGTASVVIALIVSGTLATATGLLRLWRRRFFTGWGPPSARLARRIAAFGGRGQLGNLLWLMNLRFDVVLIGALAGPAVLGIYAVASKVAELMRLVPTALNYVLYPRFARLSQARATAEVRKLLPRATALTLLLAPPLALAAYIGLPIVYGRAFGAAILPAEIIIIGLSVEGAAAVSSAFLVGSGRPGLNSMGMGTGAAITVALDVILIPRYGALGGAVTSAITYLSVTAVLVFLARRLAAAAERPGPASMPTAIATIHVPDRTAPAQPGPVADPDSRADTAMRRAVDILVTSVLLAIMLPLLVLIATVVGFSSRGPVIYRQARTGRGGKPFIMLKFRSMVPGSDRTGPLITGRCDPRITGVGALLRETKLDELPQLVNVLKGEMTLIGPRPEVPRFIPSYRDEELELLRVRPGVTGPGQIFYTCVQEAGEEADGDPETYYVRAELHPKLAIDLDYLRHRSLRTDILILLRTGLLLTGLGRTPAAAGVTPTTDHD